MGTLINLLHSIPYSILFFTGLGIKLIVGMRQFNRRGLGGLQHFSNYFVGLVTLFAEWLLQWAAFALIIWGLYGWLFR